jgi:uncharacterized membrane protein YraQ (UPF0718 family)
MSTNTAVLDRTRPVLAAGVAALGAAVVLSPYAWLETWRLTGFSTAYVPFHLWDWTPFVLLATLVARGGVSRRSGLVLAVVLAAAILPTLRLTQDIDSGAAGVALGTPAVLMLLVGGVWQFQAHRRRRIPRVASRPLVASLLLLAATGVVAGRLLDVGGVARVQTFLVISTSIIVEALPFVLLGAGVSAAIEVFVPGSVFERIAKLPLRWQVPGVALAGLAMPVCECGSVPVARRLIVRGVHPAAGVAFMLAAPVINPVVMLSTWVAYRGRHQVEMVAGRASMGLLIAIVAGTLIARRGGGELLRAEGGHDHDHGHDHAHESLTGRVRGFVDHLAADMLLMGKFIVLGAALAAAMQTVVPQHVFTGALTTPLVGALLMIVLAFVLSLCSEADAFVAVSFIQFPLSSQLAFLSAGPVLDTKLAMLYGGTFGKTFVLRLALVVVPLVVAGSMLFQVLVG